MRKVPAVDLGMRPILLLAAGLGRAACTKYLRHSEAKLEAGGPRASVVYGVMTNGLPEYREKLASQVETWAAGPLEERRFFAVAGKGAPASPAAGLIIDESCPDDRQGLVCKEERLIEEGYDRATDWFVILGEDNYVDTERLERVLGSRTASTPVVLGITGCGKQTTSTCHDVHELGGICGGGGYALSRAALEVLMADGRDALRREYKAYWGHPGDMASSCAFREKGIPLEQLQGLMGNRVQKLDTFKHIVGGSPLTLHYCTPNVMRWVHALVQRKPEAEVEVLQAAAFDGGCCCSWQDYELEACKQEAHEAAAQLQIPRFGGPPDWAALARAYVEERNALLAQGL